MRHPMRKLETLNILFIGGAGVGKTGRVNDWAEAHGVQVVQMQAQTIETTDIGATAYPNEARDAVQWLATTAFDILEKNPRTILFLDELNRARKDVRGALLTFINDHLVADPRTKSGMRKINFMFTVAGINPSETYRAKYNVTPLDRAELGRFKKVPVIADKGLTREHLMDLWSQQAKNAGDDDAYRAKCLGRVAIADAVLDVNSEFQFEADDSRDVGELDGMATPREFAKALYESDGTVDDFLDVYPSWCGEETLEVVKRCLKKYQAALNKANAALGLKFNTDAPEEPKEEEEKDDDMFRKNPVDDLLNHLDDSFTAEPNIK